MNWITENWTDILAWIGGIVSSASIIVKLTPTQKDNNILGFIIKILDYFSVVQTKENAEILKNSK